MTSRERPDAPKPVPGLDSLTLFGGAKYDLSMVHKDGQPSYALSRGPFIRGKEVQYFPCDEDGWKDAWERLQQIDKNITQDVSYMALLRHVEPKTFEQRVEADAKEAWVAGRGFYVLRLNLGGTVAGFLGMSSTMGDDPAVALETVEALGWRLESSGYLYQPLRERSHMLTDTAQMTGNLVGIFIFRRPAG